MAGLKSTVVAIVLGAVVATALRTRRERAEKTCRALDGAV